MMSHSDVLIIGAGHNGLVAACYLAQAGKSVTIVEANEQIGGASVSQRVFPDYDAQLSRYSYLVSLLPDQIRHDLALNFETIGRSVSSFTPIHRGDQELGLLITSDLGPQTQQDFAALTGSDDELSAWKSFYSDVQKIADVLAPTLLGPLPTRSELRSQVGEDIWDELVAGSLGKALESRLGHEIVQGIALTDGLIGTFADSHSPQATICFLYHLIGNGTGEWRVPRGGMGGLVRELRERAISLGVKILTSHTVVQLTPAGTGYELLCENGAAFTGEFILANCAPQLLAGLTNSTPPASLEGSQLKINMLLHKLPRVKSGVDPRLAFAGTFHFDESYADCNRAYEQARAGLIPDLIPAEMYCHTLTDPSILAPELIAQGFQTLTLFALHTPASLFDRDNEGVKAEMVRRLLAQLNSYLVDPIEECLAVAADGSLCIEAKSPLDLEQDVSLPRGNIFHKDLSLPFREDDTPVSWGVETEFPNIFICGAGAIRGGGVSGIPGHNAAQAILARS
jgi:phytoene dehydrogenase-like protein